jgi:hypothetical protein
MCTSGAITEVERSAMDSTSSREQTHTDPQIHCSDNARIRRIRKHDDLCAMRQGSTRPRTAPAAAAMKPPGTRKDLECNSVPSPHVAGLPYYNSTCPGRSTVPYMLAWVREQLPQIPNTGRFLQDALLPLDFTSTLLLAKRRPGCD